MIFTVPNSLWKAAQRIEADAAEMESAGEQMQAGCSADVAERALAVDREAQAVNS